MEWESKLHDKEQEIKMLVERYEKKIKSIHVEMEEKNTELETSRTSVSQLNSKLSKMTADLDEMKTKKTKY